MNAEQSKLSAFELHELTGQAAKYPDCKTCQRYLEEGKYFSPRHEASRFCGSGKRDHCTCDLCF